MLPLLRCLSRAHPGAALHFAGVVHGVVDRVHSVEDFAVWNVERARQRLAEFDRVWVRSCRPMMNGLGASCRGGRTCRRALLAASEQDKPVLG